MDDSQAKPTTQGTVRARRNRRPQVIESGLLRRLRWRLEFIVYVAFEGVLVLLSASTVAEMGAMLGKIGWLLLKSRRLIVRRNLRIALGESRSLGEIDALVRAVFLRTGANLLSALRSSRVSEEELKRTISIVNQDSIEELGTNTQRGAVVVLPHMGNWEALSQMIPGVMPKGHKLGSIYRYMKNQALDRRVTKARLRMGMELFEKHSGPLEMSAFIRGGGWLAVLADQRVEKVGEIVPFFGRLTSCTPLPAMMARRTDALIVGASVKTLTPGRWAVKVHKLDTAGKTTAECMKLLEETILESPEDVFWFQDRWRINKRNPVLLAGRPPRDEASAAWTKPRRALLWLTPDEVRQIASNGTGDASSVAEALARAGIRLPESPYGDLAWEYALPAGVDAGVLVKTGQPVHYYDVKNTRRKGMLVEELKRIDESVMLPVDFILALQPTRSLAYSANKLRIPVLVHSC